MAKKKNNNIIWAVVAIGAAAIGASLVFPKLLAKKTASALPPEQGQFQIQPAPDPNMNNTDPSGPAPVNISINQSAEGGSSVVDTIFTPFEELEQEPAASEQVYETDPPDLNPMPVYEPPSPGNDDEKPKTPAPGGTVINPAIVADSRDVAPSVDGFNNSLDDVNYAPDLPYSERNFRYYGKRGINSQQCYCQVFMTEIPEGEIYISDIFSY